MDKINVKANDVIAQLRNQIDQLNFENVVLKLQVQKLTAKPADKTDDSSQQVISKKED